MKQKTDAEVIAEARRHTVGNRAELENSKYAGCVSCCAVFDTKHVTDWQDEWTAPEHQNRVKRWSAKCPRCGNVSVIGNATGLLDDQAYLPVTNWILQK